MKSRILVCLSVFFVLSSQILFAHGKKDVEEIHVDNLQSWQEDIDLESRTKKKAQRRSLRLHKRGNVSWQKKKKKAWPP